MDWENVKIGWKTLDGMGMNEVLIHTVTESAAEASALTLRPGESHLHQRGDSPRAG